ncbi:hypothetical protein ONZ45_g5507 [Pleurotus djamor]|nr:hypothetical protein ONZ45_g5507 [Pleurotus djamor]
MPGIRYRIDPPAEGYRFGPWEGLSTSDMGSRWAGPKSWIYAQGSDFAKSIWYNTYWNGTLADVSFTGKPPQFDAELETWRQEHDVVARAREAQDNDEFAALKAKVNEERGGNVSETKLDMAAVMLRYDEVRRSCRAGCGVKGASMSCSKCRAVRYCSKDCQKDDWKVGSSSSLALSC